MPTPRPPLFRCPRCGRALAATPAEVRACARGLWPRCCKRDMGIFLPAARPAADDTAAAAEPLALPPAGPDAGTAVMPGLPTPPTPHQPLGPDARRPAGPRTGNE